MDDAKKIIISGRSVPLRGNDIDTDRIIPARYLRCVTFDGLGEHAFEDDREQDNNHPFNQSRYTGASILIAEKNFGCGSSREHAPQSLNKWGINGIIGESFAEIFFANCQAMGIPCLTVSHEDCQQLLNASEANPDAEVTMNISDKSVMVENLNISALLNDGSQQAFLKGTWNATAVLLQAENKINNTASSLPYLDNFAHA